MYDLYSNSPNSFELRDCAVLRNRGSIMNNRYCCASKKRAIQRTSLAAIAMAFTMPVQAQEAQSEGLAEIIVTAEKREENLQSVPVSVTAMTGEALTANGISNVEDLQFFVPGVSITNDSMAIINIRGIGTRSEEHTSELQSLMRISYAVFCLKKKTPQRK